MEWIDDSTPTYTNAHRRVWRDIYHYYRQDLSLPIQREYARETAHVAPADLWTAMVRYRRLPLFDGEEPRPPIPAEVLELVL